MQKSEPPTKQLALDASISLLCRFIKDRVSVLYLRTVDRQIIKIPIWLSATSRLYHTAVFFPPINVKYAREQNS